MNRAKTSRAQRLHKAQALAAGTTRIENTVARAASGMGGQYDLTTSQGPLFYYMTPWMQDQFSVRLYHTDWQAQKIISIPVNDILREEWTYDGLNEAHQNKLLEAQENFKVLECFKQAMRLERLIGGAVIFMGVADGAKDASEPLNLARCGPGSLKFLNVIPRTHIAVSELNMDPLKADYGRPEHYNVRNTRIHKSRLIIFPGDPLLPLPDGLLTPTMLSRNDGFGLSKLLPIYDDLMRATGTRQAAYQLIQRASVIIAQMDTMDLAGTKAGEDAISQMQAIVNQINMFQGAVVDRQPGDGDIISTMNASFGSVPELLLSNLQVLSAASDIPATRFLGQAPGGLNATGESDLENYYGRLESEQRIDLKPRLKQLLSVMGPSTFDQGFDMTHLDIVFPPMWSMSETEQSTIRTADTTNTIAIFTAGLIDETEALAELVERDVLLVTTGEAPDVSTLDPAGKLDAVKTALASAQ